MFLLALINPDFFLSKGYFMQSLLPALYLWKANIVFARQA
jgi:hypothetical protein